MRHTLLTLLLLAGMAAAAPITSVPAEGWADDSYYITTQGTRAQIKTFLSNNGVNVARVREFIAGDVESAPDGLDSVRCTRRSFVVIDGYRVIEIDWRLMQRWGDRIVALVTSAPNTYLFDRAETIQRISDAVTVTSEEVGQ